MEPLDFGDLPEDALVLVDSAPIIYFLEGHPKFGPRFKPLFEAQGAGRLRFAVTTITIAEVLTGPLQAADDALARRYRAILKSWQPIALDVDIAESAARLRASLRLKLADAVQAASALAINAAALVTHDRDFSRVRSLRISFLKAQHVDLTIVHETSSLPGATMSSIGTTLLDTLRSVARPGDFCVGGIREIIMPTIDVDGVGRIAFPILSVQAERLVAIAEAAPHGRGEETVVDREVRRTWQVDSATQSIRFWTRIFSMWRDRIVPVAVERVASEIDGGHLASETLTPLGYLFSSSSARTLRPASVVVAAISWTIVR